MKIDINDCIAEIEDEAVTDLERAHGIKKSQVLIELAQAALRYNNAVAETKREVHLVQVRKELANENKET